MDPWVVMWVNRIGWNRTLIKKNFSNLFYFSSSLSFPISHFPFLFPPPDQYVNSSSLFLPPDHYLNSSSLSPPLLPRSILFFCLPMVLFLLEDLFPRKKKHVIEKKEEWFHVLQKRSYQILFIFDLHVKREGRVLGRGSNSLLGWVLDFPFFWPPLENFLSCLSIGGKWTKEILIHMESYIFSFKNF